MVKPNKYVLFIKAVPFMFIKKGDICKVYLDGDGLPFIKIKRKRIYLNSRRDLGYFKEVYNEQEL